jgi:site-specific recombinase XerD
MIEDMTIRKLGPKTQAGYIRAVKNFAEFLGHSPNRATIDDIRRYQLSLASSGLGVPSVNAAMTALRFFFKVTLRRGEVTEDIVFAREPRRLPVVLSPDEVVRLLAAAAGVKYKAALSIAYGTGLRVSEVIFLKVGDIESTRMVIRVDQGKGHKDRYVMLSQQLQVVSRRPLRHLPIGRGLGIAADVCRDLVADWSIARPARASVSGGRPV